MIVFCIMIKIDVQKQGIPEIDSYKTVTVNSTRKITQT